MPKKTLSFTLALLLTLSLFSFTATPASAAGLTGPDTSAARLVATPISSTVLVNGRKVAFDAYNIGGNNYFKLRDLAYTLNGTAKQFDVVWDAANNAISLIGGKAYTPAGGEMASKGTGIKTPTPTNSRVYRLDRELYTTAYNIEGNNYFMLREIGRSFDFGVDWDGVNNTIAIDTSKGYTPEDGSAKTGFNFSEDFRLHGYRRIENYNLSASDIRLYDQIVAGVANFDMRIAFDSTPQTESERLAYTRVMRIAYFTHPEFFWWDPGIMWYSTQKASDGIYSLLPVYNVNGEVLRAEFKGAANEIVWPAQAKVEAGKAWVENGKAAIRERLNSLPINNNMTAYEVELAVHDWLCANNVYDNDAISDFSIYGALVGGKANCSGMSMAFQYIMGLAGIESILVEGVAPSGAQHGWNAVKLEGRWYLTDVTFDMDYRNFNNMPWHYYFNRTESFMTAQGYVAENPVVKETNPRLTCTATKFDYYNMTNSYISSDADFRNKVPARIAMARANGEWGFELEFDESYAPSSEISSKKNLIDKSLWSDIDFYYRTSGILIFGMFK